MKNFRILMSIAVFALLMLGYAASQLMTLQGSAIEYAKRVDCPPVQWLSLAILLICIALAFIRDEEADGK